jgi:hypothetical protein
VSEKSYEATLDRLRDALGEQEAVEALTWPGTKQSGMSIPEPWLRAWTYTKLQSNR